MRTGRPQLAAPLFFDVLGMRESVRIYHDKHIDYGVIKARSASAIFPAPGNNSASLAAEAGMIPS